MRCLRSFSTAKCLRAVLPVGDLSPRTTPDIVSIPNSTLSQLKWIQRPPENLFLVKKPFKRKNSAALIELSQFITKTYPGSKVIVEPDVAEEVGSEISCDIYTGSIPTIRNKADLLVTLGGDGTILHATSMFSKDYAPPVLSFSMGSLGFLLPFKFQQHADALAKIYNSEALVMDRMRLECKQEGFSSTNSNLSDPVYALNDITLHRGRSPHLSILEIYIGDKYLTEAVGDGLILSTPTGSTAYSLSSGGSIVHPSVACILLTPICPRSLSFRPLIVPNSCKIDIRISAKSRGLAELSVDGTSMGELRNNQGLLIKPSDSKTGCGPVWSVCQSDSDWVWGLNRLLGFNAAFRPPVDND